MYKNWDLVGIKMGKLSKSFVDTKLLNPKKYLMSLRRKVRKNKQIYL